MLPHRSDKIWEFVTIVLTISRQQFKSFLNACSFNWMFGNHREDYTCFQIICMSLVPNKFLNSWLFIVLYFFKHKFIRDLIRSVILNAISVFNLFTGISKFHGQKPENFYRGRFYFHGKKKTYSDCRRPCWIRKTQQHGRLEVR